MILCELAQNRLSYSTAGRAHERLPRAEVPLLRTGLHSRSAAPVRRTVGMPEMKANLHDTYFTFYFLIIPQ